MKSAFCIAGTHSGCGKTTVTLGIMAALVKRGLVVQPFKVGPDFIDPGHHRRVTGRDSHNLDGWMLSPEYNKEMFSRYTRDADIAVVEGVMGLFDGFSGSDEAGSTAQMAKILGIPVILVIDARSMARSAAAVALGYSLFDKDLPVKGVIFNMVGSEGHANYLKEAMESSLPQIPVLGCLLREENLTIPSRHLGLVTDEDSPLQNDRIEQLAAWVEKSVNLDRILSECKLALTESFDSEPVLPDVTVHDPVPIAIAMDKAFCFYYPENLRLLRETGGILKPFSPIRDEQLPGGVKGLILGGGYPELYCKELSNNRKLIKEIRNFATRGGPVYAECGGFMYLTKSITDLDGVTYPMVGIFPLKTIMSTKLESLGYREITTTGPTVLGPPGTRVRGHEFHYSYLEGDTTLAEDAYEVADRKGQGRIPQGFLMRNTLGSYIHLHWGSNTLVARNFVRYCREAKIETT